MVQDKVTTDVLVVGGGDDPDWVALRDALMAVLARS